MPNNAKVTLIGNVVSDPVQRQAGASTVTALRVAVNVSTKKDDGTYDSNFYSVSVFGKQGDYLMQQAQKGTQLWVNGDLVLRSYKTKDGADRQDLNVTATDVRCLKNTKGGSGGSWNVAPKKKEPDNDDMPF